jgi:hypothetical protein
MGNQAEPGALRRITPHRGLREGRVTEPAWAGGEGSCGWLEAFLAKALQLDRLEVERLGRLLQQMGR